MREPSWTLLMPVKRLTVAKSRLRGALAGVPHEKLALALARDTVAAALLTPGVDEVWVITDDDRVAHSLGPAGARIVDDTPDQGLNPALRHGAALAGGRPVAVLTADLPALRPEELADALGQAAGADTRRYAADALGTGTVLLTAAAGTPLQPRFGPGSAEAHAATGALPLTGAWPSLRRDVDTPADLAAAARLGLGAHTAELLRAAPPVRAGG